MNRHVVILTVFAMGTTAVWGQRIGSLKNVRVPQPSNFTQYVRDPDALVVLGKALFWDMQLGSDGRTACASCHFHAGADHRIQNQLSNPLGDFPANYTLSMADFPFHQLADINNAGSRVLRDNGMRVGSAGSFRRLFTDIVTGSGVEAGFDVNDLPAFSLEGINVRQVGPRNAPSIINAVFNFRNFWDGRASNIFSGLTPFGTADSRANAMVLADGQLTPEVVRIDNASLASQAVGPPVNPSELSYDGRTWPKLGRKMLSLRPLAAQRVAPDDSVLGPYANPNGRGLAAQHTYLGLVQTAFQPAYWNSPQIGDGYTQAEHNFSVIFGLAIQAYESTLVSDDARLDRPNALTAQEQTGLQIFQGRGQCSTCHGGPELTDASVANANRNGAGQGPGRGGFGGGPDAGFFRTGVRPAGDDIGLGGTDDFGNPLSAAVVRNPNAQQGVNGVFKTPGLRNVELTGPYFHNGGQATLEQVVDFYSRGGDFPQGNVGRGIRRVNLSAGDRAALVAFLTALTDDRVRFERAPFDHPELCVPHGALDAASSGLKTLGNDARFPLSAADKWAGIAAVGRQGNTVPLQTFQELLAGTGTDGTRAHTLTDACTIP
jgi:cytochrome c peroxidase